MNRVEQREARRLISRRVSVHHIINRCRKDTFKNLQDSRNLFERQQGPHSKRHELNHNEHPLETLQKTERFMQVMSEKAKELYQTLIAMSNEEFYDNSFIRK